MLKAKAKKFNITESKAYVKRGKKQVIDKPLLVVSKQDGVYSVRMEVTNNENSQESKTYEPLIYKICKADNDEKIKRREKITRKLIREEIKDWKDPYHPEVCNTTCLKAYRQAIGLPVTSDCELDDFVKIPAAKVSDSGSLDEDIESNCSSLDVDWEIKFTPPHAKSKAINKE